MKLFIFAAVYGEGIAHIKTFHADSLDAAWKLAKDFFPSSNENGKLKTIRYEEEY